MHRTAATPRPWHSLAWLAWALAAAASVQLAPSPVYVALVVAIAWVTVEAHAPEGPYRRAFPALVTLGVVFGAMRVAMAALTTHNGINVWFTLPHTTVPDVLGGFTVGGSVEGDVVLQAAAVGFTIVGVMAVFGAVNAIWSHYELVQAMPRAFHVFGVVVTVALAFVPATIESLRAVREADRARTGGLPVRRGRVLRSILPVLERGMERAVGLSESMDSRGFGIQEPTRADVESGWYTLGALGAFAVAFLALVGREPVVASMVGIGGIAALAAAIWIASRATTRRVYRRRRFTRADGLMTSTVLVAPLALALVSAAGNDTLAWYASPVAWPRFDPAVALALLPLLAPLVRLPARAAVGPAPVPLEPVTA
jgi:energy-coupling factor transport system permease protein